MDYEWLLVNKGDSKQILASKTKIGLITINHKEEALFIIRDQIKEQQRELQKLQDIEVTILQNG